MKKDVILIGMPGCGKTTLGERLAKELDIPFLDLDQAVEESAGITVSDIFAREGEAGFRGRETEAFSQNVGRGQVIATGGGIVTQEENYPIAKQGLVVFLDRPVTSIMEDIHTETRPLLQEGKDRLLRLHKERVSLYRKWADIIVCNQGNMEDVLKTIINEVKTYENYGN
ncbi:MAG: shikimate kinase [Clostridia bacterium]|nr:shikimate kinase [Clostridia bacterium]